MFRQSAKALFAPSRVSFTTSEVGTLSVPILNGKKRKCLHISKTGRIQIQVHLISKIKTFDQLSNLASWRIYLMFSSILLISILLPRNSMCYSQTFKNWLFRLSIKKLNKIILRTNLWGTPKWAIFNTVRSVPLFKHVFYLQTQFKTLKYSVPWWYVTQCDHRYGILSGVWESSKTLYVTSYALFIVISNIKVN